MTLRYTVATASIEQIHSHLKQCDEHFTPRLSSRVDLFEYSQKIFHGSVSFEAWEDSALVGMISAYLNDANNRTGFITNVSVLKEYSMKGIASSLLAMCLQRARHLGFARMKLRVARENRAATKLYSQAGFKVTEERGEDLVMEREILGQSTQ